MQKNKLFIIVAILTVIFLSGTAAICNQCSVGSKTVEEASAGQSTDSADSDQEGPADTDSEASTTDSTEETGDTDGDEIDDPAGGEDPAEEDNNPPVIETVTLNDRDRTDTEAMYSFVGRELDFRVQSSDPDGDELYYEHQVEGADVVSAEQVGNDYRLIIILTVAGENDVGITVFDEEDASDEWIVTLSVGTEEEGSGGYVYDDIMIEPDVLLSGQVDEERVVTIAGDSSGVPGIYVGDTPSGGITKGYLSFALGELTGKTVDEAELVINSLTPSNDPTSLLGSNLDFFAVDYGDSLDGDDYRTGRYTYLSGMAPDSTRFVISGEALKNAIQEVLDDPANNNFQVKLFFENANDNGDADGVIIYMSDVLLNITYYPA